MSPSSRISLGKYTALLSFIVGTVLFMGFYFTSSYQWLFAGYAFILLAGLVNTVVFILVLTGISRYREHKKTLLRTAAFMLTNIPVVIVYSWVVILLMSTLRITFVNTSVYSIAPLVVTGCGTKQAVHLPPGESKTVWIYIHADCNVLVNYDLNGVLHTETVVDYATHNDGKKIEYVLKAYN